MSVVCVAVSDSVTCPSASKVHTSHWKLKYMQLMGSAYTSINSGMTDFYCVPECKYLTGLGHGEASRSLLRNTTWGGLQSKPPDEVVNRATNDLSWTCFSLMTSTLPLQSFTALLEELTA